MSNNARDKAAQEEHFADIFARLREQDIEQFYAHYQLWVLRRRVPLLENQLEAMREHLAENQQNIEALRPSALALAVLVRLQSNGVSDTDVLDLMLNRGEDWLDRMMQRLDYCEQVQDFIQGDYTQWCVRSLEGAYDWIDSLLGSIKETDNHQENGGDEIVATEELLLQKLSLDDEEAMLNVMPQPAAAQPASEDNSELSSAQVPIPVSEHYPGREASDEIEPAPELVGWKDLEDLEASEGYPAPWYSVNVTEDGASASNDAGQTVVMNDWIKVLQADNVDRTETEPTEAVTYSTAERVNSTDQATTTEIDAPAIPLDQAENGTDTQATEPADTPASNPEEEESAMSSATPGAPETSDAESTSQFNETGDVEDEADEVTLSTQRAEDEHEQATGESLVTIEESEPPASAQETGTRTDIEAETSSAEASAREEALIRDEQTETEEPRAQAREALPGTDQPVEQAESVESERTLETSKAEPDAEIETAAILNDIFSLEGEQDEQLPWYEYLEIEEPAHNVAHTVTEEAGVLEEVSSTSPIASSTSEVYEHVIVEEPANEQITAQSQDSELVEATTEIEGWQTWQIDDTNEETLPFALKDLQSAQQSQTSNAQELIAREPDEMQDETGKPALGAETSALLDAGIITDEVNAEPDMSIASDEINTNVEIGTAAAADKRDAGLDTSAPKETTGNPETPVFTPDEIPAMQNTYTTFAETEARASAEKPVPGWSEPAPTSFSLPDLTDKTVEATSAETLTIREDQQANDAKESKVEAIVEQVLVRRYTEPAPLAPPVLANEKPPKKLGFWRRLFSFGKKSKG